MDKNVLVIGATGKTGSLICKELEAKKINYTVFVRKQSAGKLSTKGGVIKHGDVFNAQDVENALLDDNFTDVVIALGSAKLRNATIRSKGTEHILKAMQKGQSKASVHVISALGVGDSWKQLKWHAKLLSTLLLRSVMKDHSAQEDLVQNSMYPYHILRPVGLKDGASKGGVHVQNEGFLPSNYIQRADVAKYLVDSLLEGKTGVSGICEQK
ncbi:MAG: SDR family oxidoreductase [Aureispira sp.]|nr:SDR family oxidoreductase [Aureispira sp.]